MCISQQQSAPAAQQVVARQSYKSPASRASLASQGAATGGGGDMSATGLLDATPAGGRTLAGGDQKLMPDLSSENSIGGSILTDSPSSNGARGQPLGVGGSRSRGRNGIAWNTSAPWLALMQGRTETQAR